MLNVFRRAKQEYPRQYWLMFTGMLISTVGSSMIWPFLMIYVSERLSLPLTTVASLMTINAVMGLISSFIAGPLIDRLGRKWIMVVGLLAHGISYLMMSWADSLPVFALLMGINGIFTPLYRVGADAMMADLIPPEKRMDAYSLLRMSNNLGVALGPALGGVIATISYTYGFILASFGLVTYGLLMLFFARETLPKIDQIADQNPAAGRGYFGGYDRVLRDGSFMTFNLAFTLVSISVAMMWMLLGVYSKQNYQLSESLYGLIPATNAIMVVTLQIAVTQITKRFPPLPVMTLGALIYAVAIGSIAFGRGFWAFWVCMVVLTLGELILIPTSSTYVANLAPADMRGRYMGVYSLTWGAAMGVGPVLGGFLNDNLGPVFIWYGGGLIGLLSVLVFLLQARRPSPLARQALDQKL